MKHFHFFIIIIIVTAIGLNSCNEQRGCPNAKAINFDPTVKVADGSCVYPSLELVFTYNIDSLPFEINRIYSIDGYNTAFKVFQCYLSKIQLERPDQSVVNYENLYPLINVTNNHISLGQVNVETFEYLNFNIGVDAVANNNIAQYLNNQTHPLAAQSPDTMHWNVVDGYIFLKMVGKVDRNGDGIPNENEAFNFQIGTNQLLRSINLLVDKKIKQEFDKIELEIDVRKLLTNIDLQTEKNTRTTDNLALATKMADNIVSAIRVKN